MVELLRKGLVLNSADSKLDFPLMEVVGYHFLQQIVPFWPQSAFWYHQIRDTQPQRVWDTRGLPPMMSGSGG
jgi:hypothetical protein